LFFGNHLSASADSPPVLLKASRLLRRQSTAIKLAKYMPKI
jgi:hypothetical protein